MVFTNPTPREWDNLRTYVGNLDRMDNIQSVRLAIAGPNQRDEDQWEYVAIKFRDGTPLESILQTVVHINASEFSHIEADGSYVFWFD